MIPYAAAAAIHASANRILTAPRPVDTQSRGGIEELRMTIERQNLMIQTLLMILLEKQVIQEEEFREWLIYVDELDGVRDGRVREDKTPVACPKCHRNSPRTATKCIFCGHEFEVEFLARRPDQPE